MDPTLTAWNFRARVLYTLGSSFLLPPISLSYLTTSIELYRHAISLTDSNLLHLDAAYNLAQSLMELAETIEDIHPDRVDEVRSLRSEARTYLEQVLIGQEEYVSSHTEELEIDQASETVDHEVLSKSEPPASAKDETMDEDQEASAEADGEDDEGAATFETHVPTPNSIVDTALLLVDLCLTLWTTTSAETPQPPSEEEQVAVRSVIAIASRYIPVGRQAEIDLLEIKILLKMDEIVWGRYKAEAVGPAATQNSGGIEKSLEGAIAALNALLNSLDSHPPEEKTLRAEILILIGETHSAMVNRLLYVQRQNNATSGDSPIGQSCWFNLSQAVTAFGKALDLPAHPDTPNSFKPSVLLQLSQTSLARAKLVSVNETARRNEKQLLDNAMTYVDRALDGLGSGWYGNAASAGSAGGATGGMLVIGGGAGGSAQAAPWQAGWDTEVLIRTCVLHKLRTVQYISTNPSMEQEKEKYLEMGRTIISRLQKLGTERRPDTADVERWVGSIRSEEEGLSVEEAAWCGGLAAELEKK
jgi:hypothetical protein